MGSLHLMQTVASAKRGLAKSGRQKKPTLFSGHRQTKIPAAAWDGFGTVMERRQ
jgi:hypothetical protein